MNKQELGVDAKHLAPSNLSIDEAIDIVRKYEVNEEHHEANEVLISAACNYFKMIEEMIQRNKQEIANLNFSMRMQELQSEISHIGYSNNITINRIC